MQDRKQCDSRSLRQQCSKAVTPRLPRKHVQAAWKWREHAATPGALPKCHSVTTFIDTPSYNSNPPTVYRHAYRHIGAQCVVVPHSPQKNNSHEQNRCNNRRTIVSSHAPWNLAVAAPALTSACIRDCKLNGDKAPMRADHDKAGHKHKDRVNLRFSNLHTTFTTEPGLSIDMSIDSQLRKQMAARGFNFYLQCCQQAKQRESKPTTAAASKEKYDEHADAHGL